MIDRTAAGIGCLLLLVMGVLVFVMVIAMIDG